MNKIQPITSIMVVCYNRLELTKQTLASLFKETKSPFRLIIIDNSSSDGTVEFLKNFDWTSFDEEDCLVKNFLGVDLHFNDTNRGIAVGRNQALKIANQYNDPYLCCIDNDVEFPVNWLSDCVNFLEVNSKFSIGVNYERINYPIIEKNGKRVQLKPAGNLGGATMVFPRDLHNSIGYFITDYGLYSCEDSDWGWRARLAGYNLAYLPINGTHLGEGENDTGTYREFKDKAHQEISILFKKSCGEYSSKRRSIFIDFKEKE